MKNTNLRAYIPLSAPLNWEPGGENEPNMRLVVGFTTHWFHEVMGIDFSEKWHSDPIYRYSTLGQMEHYLSKTFPGIPYLNCSDTNKAQPYTDTLSGVYGVCLIAMVYGLPIQYYKNNWPDIKPGYHLSREQIKKLKPFNLYSNPITEQLFSQFDIIKNEWGTICGYLNYQGVLNNAFKIRGSEILADMIDDDGLCEYFFEHITDTMLQLSSIVQRKQRETGFNINSFCTSNCVVNMISPSMYRKLILPFDMKIAKVYDAFGIHNCNWNVNPYLEEYRKISNVNYIDLGISSDLEKVKKMFPRTGRAVFYNPTHIVEKSREDIEVDLQRLDKELSPCDIILADIDKHIPNSKINEFMQALLKYCKT